MTIPNFFSLSPEVARARSMGLPVVALESAVITHGLPYPENAQVARQSESEVRGIGCTPATFSVLDGKICAGINDAQLERLAKAERMVKISARDFANAIACRLSGGTTVAGTIVAASRIGLHVFATGGIGGVHRQVSPNIWERQKPSFDVSADLEQLARIPMIVVCAGAKAILDLPATLEMLETLSVPVIGYGTNDFPAFYSRSSGLKVSIQANAPGDVVRIARAHWDMGLQSAVLVVTPPPEDTALPYDEVEKAVQKALEEAAEKKKSGGEVTPFLLDKVRELTGGASLQANVALLRNNARLAAMIAREFAQPVGRVSI